MISFDSEKEFLMHCPLFLPKEHLSIKERFQTLLSGRTPKEPYSLDFKLCGKGSIEPCLTVGDSIRWDITTNEEGK